MKRFALGLVAFVMLAGPIHIWASGCDEEDIDTVSDDGEIIELTDGSVWRSLDPGTSSTWLSAETVLVCDDDVMINKDENGEKIDVVRK